MVTYLKKLEGSEGFHQIVDFLNSSHFKYALTENPPIYESFIKKFWQTASTSTLEDGEVGITTTIDGQLKTITKASLRIHIKLEDADGVSSLPNIEIFEQLALIGVYITPTLTQKLFGNMKRASKGYTGVDIPLFPTMLVQGPILQGEGSTVQEAEVPQPSSPSQTHDADEATSIRVDVRLGGAFTIVSSLDAG
ncbi:hypothetical protein Tco_0309712 [Tanacetum coccineum]